ncbi:MAG: hypothetical protein IPJ79_13790 [Bacteroidetes bacterium]|nr:hypothetical protein [Bacteroidota bacterium]
MRKLFLAFVALAFSVTATAQELKQPAETVGMFMRGKQVMYAKRGYVTDLKSNQTLGSGSTLTTNGTLTKTDGTTAVFKPGVLYNFDGEAAGTVTEYITVKGATCVLMTNEIATTIEGFKFENGETINKAGMLSNSTYLKEGDKILLSGEVLK